MTIAVYPGSFDPITVGHLDIIQRASKMFDEVYIAIMHNPRKTCSFSEEERAILIKKCTKDYPNVKVIISDGLTVNLCKKLNAKVIIRGIRAIADYEYELAQATANMMIDSDIETAFLVAKPEYSFISSSIAKEIAMFEGDISKFIPDEIKEDIYNRLYSKRKTG